jgi:hypothetical protein
MTEIGPMGRERATDNLARLDLPAPYGDRPRALPTNLLLGVGPILTSKEPTMKDTAGHGRTTRNWRRLRIEIFSKGLPCCRCGMAINYALPPRTPDSPTLDHYPFPLSTHPWLAEDRANLAPAHLRCNSSAGAGFTPPPGQASEAW